MAVSSRNINLVVSEFNSVYPRLEFTVETEVDGKLPFLDTLVIRSESGELKTDWYHKETWSRRFLNFKFYLPENYKKNTVSILTRKVLELANFSFHEKNFELIKEVLVRNNYPITFVKKIMENTIQNFNTPTSRIREENIVSLPYDTFPFKKKSSLL